MQPQTPERAADTWRSVSQRRARTIGHACRASYLPPAEFDQLGSLARIFGFADVAAIEDRPHRDDDFIEEYRPTMIQGMTAVGVGLGFVRFFRDGCVIRRGVSSGSMKCSTSLFNGPRST
jgi:hypothetical protein